MPAITFSNRIEVVDSHTGGEPTRIVVAGGPNLGNGSMRERMEVFRSDYDHLRSAIVNEPRGSDVIVGALLCEPVDPSCDCGVFFFNNVGPINMCIHGTIGLVVTLAHLERIDVGQHRIETPVGMVTATLHEDGRVSAKNVPSYRYLKDVKLQVDDYGEVTGDVAWGGNWFFLVNDHKEQLHPSNVDRLTDVCWRIRRALERDGVAGADGPIDHIELFGPPSNGDAHSKNFVLCPGGAYDRSPCGTGTSAKVACLVADGKIQPGEVWRQESIVGSVFEGVGTIDGDRVIPTITGTAFITAEATLLLQDGDPYQTGIHQ
jgi:4-hydroxyproline epimerase